VWLDSRTGKEIRRRASSATGATVALRFSSSEFRIAAGSADGAVRLLDADSGEELLVLEGLPGPAASLVFFPDGRRLAASAATILRSGTIAVWDGRLAGDSPPLPAPDMDWHKARLAVAGGSSEDRFSLPIRDSFAMRYHLSRLAALDPNDIQWPRGLLALDQEAGDYRAAAARLDGIVRRWPGDATMWYDLGNARRELGDVAGAEAAFRKCIALDPGMPEAQCNLGLLLAREGRFADALEFISRGHERGMALKKAGKRWDYPSASWLARQKRLGHLAALYGARQEFSDVPETDRIDLVEVLTLTRRPLAAIRLADPRPEASPGPVVISAAIRCAEGTGDAGALSAAERSAWRAKALAWLRLDYELFRSSDPPTRARQCTGMRSHPLLQIAQGDRLAAWPAAERAAWQQFWADVDAAAKGR
jgi:tetratricopeptide (TPR) repeat protein